MDDQSDLDLTLSQSRVLGSLLEKELVTPNAYPTTFNALVAACNQLTNREPTLHLDQHQVESAALALKSKGLLRVVHPGSGERSTRYREVADELLGLDEADRALICLLLLRGAQTAAELRSRAERLHGFPSTEAVESALADLARRQPPLVRRLERMAGQKEARWMQLLESPTARGPVSTSGPAHTATVDARPWPAHRSPGDEMENRQADVRSPTEVTPSSAVVQTGAGPTPARHDPDALAPLSRLERRLEALETRLESLIDALGDLVDLNSRGAGDQDLP